MSGHIRRRGERSWELKYEAGTDPHTGRRSTRFVSFKGSKREAQAKLAALITAVATDTHVEPNKITVADFVRERIDQWEASAKISAKTATRYRELAKNQIAPHIGAKVLQKLRPLDIEDWHTALRNSGRADGKGGIHPRTIGHAHRVLSKALTDAIKNRLVMSSATKLESAPKVAETEMVIVRDLPVFLDKLKESARLYVPAMLSLFTGMRRGEVLALRWARVDLDKKMIQVREALEKTDAYGIRFKSPKSNAGRRDITLPDILVKVLQEHRKTQLELRMRLGIGKLYDTTLLFADLNDAPLSPNALSVSWNAFAQRIGMPEVTFHALRHTHASQLIDAGVDIVTISKRLGHAKPDITLRVYSHLFSNDDSKAAVAINAALKSIL
jgi:integrase